MFSSLIGSWKIPETSVQLTPFIHRKNETIQELMSYFKIVFKTVIHGDPDLKSHPFFFLVYFLSSIRIYCYDNLNSILKIRDITLPTKVHIVKGMVSQVVMYGCES